MMTPQTIIDRVRKEPCPPDWRVFRGKGGWGWSVFLSFALLLVGGFLMAVLAMILAQATGTVWPYPVGLLLVIGLAAWPLFSSFSMSRSLLVILPEGVIEYYRGNRGGVATLHFEDIQRMDMGSETMVSGN